MALIDHIDGITRRIYLSVDTMNTAWHPVDIYREVRALRRDDEELRKYNSFIKGDGNVDKGGGKATERYFTLLDGTRIVPYDQNHIIDITGTLITDDGYEGAFCFDKTLLSPGISVDIQYAPKQVEVINLNFDDLVYSSFQGAVWVDASSMYSDAGSDILPNGNAERPVNNMQLATQIAEDRGFKSINVNGTYVLGAGDIVDNYTIIGRNPTQTQIIIQPEASTIGVEIFESYVAGTLDGGTVLRSCLVDTINYFNGFLVDCVLSQGVITIGGNAEALFLRCVSGVPGVMTPIIDMGGSGQSLGLRDYSGGITIRNKTGDDPFSIDLTSGKVVLEDTVSAGTMTVRGTGYIEDSSTGTAYVINQLVNATSIQNLQATIEFLRGSHTATGNIWYWDPYGGDDTNDGKETNRAFKTFAYAHSMCIANNHDVIMAVAGDPSGTTTTNEQIIMTKGNTYLRGAGRDFEIKQLNTELNAVEVLADGCEVSGFTISTTADNNFHAIYGTGSFTLLKDLYIIDSKDGIELEGGEYSSLVNIRSHHNTGYGIKLKGNTQHAEVIDCHLGGNAESGLIIDTINGHEVVIKGNTIIHRNGQYGLYISPTSEGVTVHPTCSVFANTLGDIEDLGTKTYIGKVQAVVEGVATKEDVIVASQL